MNSLQASHGFPHQLLVQKQRVGRLPQISHVTCERLSRNTADIFTNRLKATKTSHESAQELEQQVQDLTPAGRL